MNAKKARELFSAYAEDALEPGLRRAFERELEASPSLREEYERFGEAIHWLESTKDEPIETPAFLAERISGRVDRAESVKAAAKPGLFGWKGLGWGALAATAVFATVLTLTELPRRANTAAAGLTGELAETSPALTLEAGRVILSHQASGEETVVVSQGSDGRVVDTIELGENAQAMRSPLENTFDSAVVLIIAAGEADPLAVALPGTAPQVQPQGAGSLIDFAAAASDAFGEPLELRVSDLNRPVGWTFEEGVSLEETVSSIGLALDRDASGLASLSD